MFSHRKQYAIWLLYLPVAAVLMFFAINLFMQGELINFSYLLLLLLGAVVAAWPIKTEADRDFSLETGVSIATFVIFGLVRELILSTMAMVLMMRRLKIERDQHYRYALNLLAVTAESVLSAVGYYLVDGYLLDLGYGSWPRMIISLLVYAVIHSITNNLNMYLAYKYFYRIRKTKYNRKSLFFSIQTNVIFVGVATIYIFLYGIYGIWGQILGTFPFLFATANLNYYYKTKRNNIYLAEVNRHVTKLTERLNRKDVIYAFITSLLEIFPIDKIYYFQVHPDETIEAKRIYYNAKMYDSLAKDAADVNGAFFNKVIKHNKISVYDRGVEWLSEEMLNDHTIMAESAIAIPVDILGNVRGLILLVNEQRSAYSDFIVSLIEVFYQYFTSVLHNADQYEKLEVTLGVDELTKLANFRGFSEKIKSINDTHNFEQLSIIILDLDFFKKVNDTHGHNAGNEVLVQLADVLKEFETNGRFISRYGGEEFIFLLKNHSKETAYELAEEIRKTIAERVYHVHDSILNEVGMEVNVTASFGVATYPDDTNDIYKLVLLADGVMYKDSKQTGRNKVSVFTR